MKIDETKLVSPALTILLCILVSLVSLIGVVNPGFYAGETLNWQIQSRAQDEIDLFFITPVMLVAGINASGKNHLAVFIWGGALLYLVYTFTIYCFAVHFNFLFPVYCLILGLAMFAFARFIYLQLQLPVKNHQYNQRLIRITGSYLIGLSLAFYSLWMAEIIGAIRAGNTPPSIVQAGLPTNPVHAIDLSVMLPGMLITGVYVLKRRPPAMIFAAILLAFFVLMDISIAWLSIRMKQEGLPSQNVMIVAMIFLALFSLALFILNTNGANGKRHTETVPRHTAIPQRSPR